MDTDASGWGHYVLMIRYVERAELLFMEGLGLDLDALYRETSFPRRHLSVDYLAPVRFGDRLQLAIGVASLGRASYTLRFQARQGASGTLAMAASLVIVAIDPASRTPVPLPPVLRGALQSALWPDDTGLDRGP
jgi:acyl-CoA thioester hydrolase